MKSFPKIATILIVIIFSILLACEKYAKPDFTAPKTISSTKKVFKSGTSSYPGACTTCLSAAPNPNPCGDCVINKFFVGGSSKKVNITWSNTGCTSKNPSTNCGTSYYITTATFSYADPTLGGNYDCFVCMEFDYLPPCLSCITSTFPYCMIMQLDPTTTFCNNDNDWSITLIYTDPVTQQEVRTTITQNVDPNFQMCCTDASGYQNCCHGYY